MLANLLGPMLYGISTNQLPNDVTRNNHGTRPSLLTIHLDGDRSMEARSNWQRKSLTTPSMPTVRRAHSEKLASSPLRCGPLLTSTELADNDDLPCSAVGKTSRSALLTQPFSVGVYSAPEAQLLTIPKARQFVMLYVRPVLHREFWASDRNPLANGPHSGTSQRPSPRRHLAATPRSGTQDFIRESPTLHRWLGRRPDQRAAEKMDWAAMVLKKLVLSLFKSASVHESGPSQLRICCLQRFF